MSDNRPIAVFDSGLGGLTIVHELRQQMPSESIVYLGDTLRCPYGGRSREAIRSFTDEVTRFLLSKEVKMVIAACNTVSAIALDVVQKSAGTVPVLGVVGPGCRAAVKQSPHKTIGVIGTRATIGAGVYGEGIRALDSSVLVYEKACPLLVPLVEEGFVDTEISDLVLRSYLDELLAYRIDSLVLGCTHYPLLSPAIRRVLGDGVEVIDSAWWTASAAKDLLADRDALSSSTKVHDCFYVTDMTPQFEPLATAFLQGTTAEIHEIDLQAELASLEDSRL